MTTYKILFVGDGGVGKTTYIKRLKTADFQKIYKPTLGVVETEIKVDDTIFQCVEFPGQEKLADEKFNQTCDNIDGVIAMFDVTSRMSYRNVSVWIRKIRKNRPNIPIVMCGNKVDCKDMKVKDVYVPKGINYYYLSAKSNYNLEKPFQNLALDLGSM